MRTVEVLFVIVILLSAFVITSQFAILPSPRQAFGTNLREQSQSILDNLDRQGMLSKTVFSNSQDDWADLQKALSASLQPNVVYNLTVHDILTGADGVTTYRIINSTSDASFGADSDSASLLVASPDVTHTKDIEKIGNSTGQEITLYILNCEDANGWWITGFTGQSLATEFYDLLSSYFTTTVFVNSTSELDSLLTGHLLTSDPQERVNNAVVVNTFGEAVPISESNASSYSGDYAKYCYDLGRKVNTYNWTWVSIVGYPFYYVTNTNSDLLKNLQNTKGIYGMDDVNQAGLNAFLKGLKNTSDYTGPDYADIKVQLTEGVTLSSEAISFCNNYGIYPSPTQTASRALKNATMIGTYQLVATKLFNLPSSGTPCIPAATYKNVVDGVGHGAFTAIGLARIPDVRVTALALLMYYHPNVYRSNFGDRETSRLVTLQLGQQGGT